VAKSTGKARATKSVRKAPTRTRRAQTKPKKAAAPSVASRLPPMTPEKTKAAKEKFERGILTRGEAVPEGTPLPPGATHEIVGTNPDGTPILKRKRFSLK
jgi:hypothetical protein